VTDHREDHADRHGFRGPDELDLRTVARGGTPGPGKYLDSNGEWSTPAGGTGGGLTVEDAQDAVGQILTDTATIDLTYNDATPSITALVKVNSIGPNELAPTAVAPGTYGSATEIPVLNVDGDGRVVTASNVLAAGGGGGGPPSGGAGGVLSGTYPNPGFAADMATQAELDGHVNDTVDAHDASAISVVPFATVASTNVQGALEEIVAEAVGGGGGAPTTADYLVGSANAGLSAEIVVGLTPGGELGGTWAAPTVDALHAGSTHAQVQAAAENSAQAALNAHDADTTGVHGIANTANLVTSSRAISAGTGLVGGGDLTANRTLAMDPAQITLGVWTTFTPLLTQGLAINVTGYCKYTRIGRTIVYAALLNHSSGTGTAGAPLRTNLPVACAMPAFTPLGVGNWFDSSTGTLYRLLARLTNAVGALEIQFLTTDSNVNSEIGVSAPNIGFASGDQIGWTITYEAQS
jgi:hypothetical protein